MSSRSNSPSKTLTENIDKSFSPIKINLTATDDNSPNKLIIHHKTPLRIVHHPHGLSAKHEAYVEILLVIVTALNEGD